MKTLINHIWRLVFAYRIIGYFLIPALTFGAGHSVGREDWNLAMLFGVLTLAAIGFHILIKLALRISKGLARADYH